MHDSFDVSFFKFPLIVDDDFDTFKDVVQFCIQNTKFQGCLERGLCVVIIDEIHRGNHFAQVVRNHHGDICYILCNDPKTGQEMFQQMRKHAMRAHPNHQLYFIEPGRLYLNNNNLQESSMQIIMTMCETPSQLELHFRGTRFGLQTGPLQDQVRERFYATKANCIPIEWYQDMHYVPYDVHEKHLVRQNHWKIFRKLIDIPSTKAGEFIQLPLRIDFGWSHAVYIRRSTRLVLYASPSLRDHLSLLASAFRAVHAPLHDIMLSLRNTNLYCFQSRHKMTAKDLNSFKDDQINLRIKGILWVNVDRVADCRALDISLIHAFCATPVSLSNAQRFSLSD